jgi:hypothetical protein
MEFAFMRIPAVLIFAALVSATNAVAQDVQFRTVATTEALGLALPGFTMNVSIKGQLTRIDMDVAGMWFSSIVDHGAKKMLMLNHEEMTFTERAAVRTPEAADVAAPQVRETGETREIAGLPAKRIVMLEPDGEKGTMIIQEMWVASDTKLAAAFRRYISAMSASGKASPAGQLFDDIPNGAFPLRITMIVVGARPDEKLDVDALLKGEVAAGKIQMRMVMQTSDIHTADIEPAIFAVPSGYVKASR